MSWWKDVRTGGVMGGWGVCQGVWKRKVLMEGGGVAWCRGGVKKK